MIVVGRYPYFWLVSLNYKDWTSPINRTTSISGFQQKWQWMKPEPLEEIEESPKKIPKSSARRGKSKKGKK